MIEVPATLRCRCGVTYAVTISLAADNHDIRRHGRGVRFGIRHVTVDNLGNWSIDDHGAATCPKCK